MAKRQNTFLLKRSNVPGKIPLPGDLQLGELALNTADAKLYTSGTTADTILQIGWDRINRTGDTVTGDFNFFGDIQISGSSLPNGYTLSVTGDTNLNGDLYVTGDTQLVNVSGSSFYTDYIDFNTSYVSTIQEGRLHWDLDYGTLDVDLEGGDISLKVGLDNLYYIKNQSGSTIDKGRVVRAAGTLGSSGRLLGEYMIADGTIPYYFTLGIAGENILDGEDGYVYEFGLVRGFNTTGSLYGETWVDGDILYVSPTIVGGLTKFEPTEPNLKIQMAIVIDADTNGSIFVRPNLSSRLEDLHDLQTSGATNGDLISFDSSDNIWKYSKNLNGDYTINGNLTVTGNTDIIGILNIGTLGTGTSVTNLGIDINGNVVSGGTGGGGESNTASNLGGGEGLFAQKVGVDLQFKSLTSTGGTISISSDSTTVNIEKNNIVSVTIVTGTTYSATTIDNVIGFDTSSVSPTLFLPNSTTTGRIRYEVKDIGINSFTNPITIQAFGSDTIITTEVVSSFQLSADGGAIILVSTGTGQWWQM